MREMGGIYVGDGPKLMGGGIEAMTYAGSAPVVVTDPPFDFGYRYGGYSDRMDEGGCYAMLAGVTAQTAASVIRYPEQLHRLGIERREAVEFPRTHRCLHEGRNVRNKTAAGCYRCVRASRAPFGNDDALCDLDSPGPGMRQRPAGPIEGKS